MYHLTFHASQRAIQRCISQEQLHLLLKYGRTERAVDGAEVCYMTEEVVREIGSESGIDVARRFPKLAELAAVICGGEVITVFRRHKRTKREVTRKGLCHRKHRDNRQFHA